jgi:dTDP-4-dehydrorhamnose 3,5-epimerase
MQVNTTSISGVLIIQPRIFSDSRGFFMESYRESSYQDLGIGPEFIQDNHSGSTKGVLRGIHYQIQHPQGKLVRVIKGEVFDVAVDLRKSSPTFGHYVGTLLTEENHKQLWVPQGFGHGFYVLSEWAEFIYKVTDIYAPEWERTIIWDDPDLGIEWPLVDGVDVIISEKDAKGNRFLDADVFE